MLYKPFINVAEIGTYSDFSASIYYRTQYTGFDGNLSNQGASANFGVNDKNTFGATISKDAIGELTSRYRFMGNYSFKMQFNEANSNFLLLGLAAGVETLSINRDNISATDHGDLLIDNLGYREYVSPQASVGATYYFSDFYVGLSVLDLFYQSNTEDNQELNFMQFDQMNFYIYGGYNWQVSKMWDVDFSSLLRYVEGNTTQVDFNTHITYNDFLGLGVAYRTSNEMFVMANVRFLKDFTFGYAFEYHMANSNLSSMGTHELILIYELGTENNKNIFADSDTDVLEPAAIDQKPIIEEVPPAVELAYVNPLDIDSDGDGVPDVQDDCPDEVGTIENHGCPVVVEDVINKINMKAKHIKFNSGKASIAESSKDELKDLAEIMKVNVNAQFNIHGFSDSVGNDQKNLSLSQQRADAVRTFFISYGIEDKRLNSLGFGEESPIADNKTAEGREANRRVEIHLIDVSK